MPADQPGNPDTDFDLGEDEVDIELRSPLEIGQRLVALSAIADRQNLEFMLGDAPGDSAYELETDWFDLLAWARRELGEFLLPGEMEILKTPPGSLNLEVLTPATYALEQAVALAWASEIIPDHHVALPLNEDFHSQHEAVERWRPKPWDVPDRKLRKLSLRSEESVWDERERFATARIWWLTSFGAANDVNETSESLWASVVENNWEDEASSLFPTFDSMQEIDEETRRFLIGSLEEIVRALTWTCGLGTNWDDVPWDDLA